MKTPSFFFVLCVMLSLISCNKKSNKNMVETWKQEILDTELGFSDMAQKEGMNTAFLAFVADDAVLLRNDKLIKGKHNIQSYMKNSASKGLSWKPDFVDVSSSGDLGYTYGEYTYTFQDSLGTDVTSKGIFHTVWKRQPDGSWKFAWD